MPAEYTLFQSILPEEDDRFIDDTYNSGELDNKDAKELQSIAAAHESDSVHGNMKSEELRSELEGMTRVND